ncbi:prolyl 4-hydroxylase subunit alpha-1 isoform X2 [Anthonomus grandis grandis]|uniref:prolyl 4-hydroxylase subunit alpha-1 isoform X2 n=1 Tax=Anthonomus grandis grandis TaxID=2921223 RepID=UPI0021666A50|nr:prolyl 4-hydroxylase subunit alpha-1 isoform X2 [Anthonomus grandis grandis]
MNKCHIFIVIKILFLVQQCQCEVYTAMVDLEDLLDTEHVLINTIENYIKAEEQKMDLLKRYMEIYKKQQNIARRDTQLYLSNPINAYTLVKRLTADWTQVEALIGTNINQEALLNISYYKENMKFPTDEDLNGAAVALTRLQDTYQLDTSSLARGELNGVKYSSELTAADCFELGRQSYNVGDFYHTRLWMQEAEARLKREANETVDHSEVLEYLAFSIYKQGDVALALDLTNKLLDIIPDHGRALGNRVYYEDQLKTSEDTKTDRKKGDDESQTVETAGVNYRRDLYEALCRGDETLPVEVQAKLKCRYITRGNPFLLMAPFKVEEAHLDPDIFIFHDVISDNEIQTIKAMATPRFQRATVQNSQTGALEVAGYRISKSAWLKEEEHKHIADVSRRTGDITGLNMKSSEELQVVNYGIGGHYEPHFDFARKEETNAFKNLGTGNRIATVLYYMSDVPQGGATVFPEIRATVWPKKGTAAFWYNLFPSGDGDARTRHAACPVLAGSKWVSNKWLHEEGQEFIRPCTKERPPEELTA